MSSNDFPVQTTSSLGQFWLPNLGDLRVTGMLEVDGTEVRLDVSPELTPRFSIEATGSSGSTMKMRDDPDDMVVLGSIPLRPSKITLWDSYTTRRRSFLGRPNTGPSMQRLAATWCIVGEHLPDPDLPLQGIRPDVTNLAEWAAIPALSTTVHLDDRLKLDWHMDLRNKSLDAELVDDAGYVTLGPSVTHRPPGIRGFHVKATSQLEFELFNGWSITDVGVRVLNPLADLMTLISGKPCSIRSLDVWAGKWCSVHGYRIDPSAPEAAGELLFTRMDVGLEFLPRWLEVHRRTTPVPQILAAVIRNEFPTVESDALSLATAVEALHRTLHPDARRFSTEQIGASLSAVGSSNIPPEIAESFSSALRNYWHECSYPQRVAALAGPVVQAVPACIGRLGRWKKEVVDQRIALAHGLGQNGLGGERLRQMLALNQSLHWMLTLRLLIEAGVQDSVLASATEQSERFSNQRDNWNSEWPRIFAG
ncbi:ApeA N-terminal domain 1-containing protein [Mycolicibacterium conceptionense]|uniref:ApeA N-terminal domain 1-containing protein n=1 Tax=Mycolicibacterium conceptionense TaxID=451644 RepID=UPI0013A5B9F0|nr:HEPN domain-containing protein [Mycolicibacterium conceptionense]